VGGRSGFRSKCLAVLVLVVAGYALLFHLKYILRWLYPIHYRESIEHYARENDLDPFLVTAVVSRESGFDPKARSVKGAVGLMQVLPSTGKWILEQMGEDRDLKDEELQDPDFNLQLGCWYLADLHREFDNNRTVALAAYNAGRGNVRQWLELDLWSGRFSDLARVPFAETRNYVRRVIAGVEWYRYVYDSRWP